MALADDQMANGCRSTFDEAKARLDAAEKIEKDHEDRIKKLEEKLFG